MSWLQRLVERSGALPVARSEIGLPQEPVTDPDDPEVDDELRAAQPLPAPLPRHADAPSRSPLREAFIPASSGEREISGRAPEALRPAATNAPSPSALAPERTARPVVRTLETRSILERRAEPESRPGPRELAAAEERDVHAARRAEPAARERREAEPRELAPQHGPAPLDRQASQSIVPEPAPPVGEPREPARLTIGRVVVEVTPPARPVASPSQAKPSRGGARLAPPARPRRSFQRFGLEST